MDCKGGIICMRLHGECQQLVEGVYKPVLRFYFIVLGSEQKAFLSGGGMAGGGRGGS